MGTLRLRAEMRRRASYQDSPRPCKSCYEILQLSAEQLSPEGGQAQEARPKKQERRRLRRGCGALDLEANSVRVDHTRPAIRGRTTTEVSEL